jgi:hypothetical protein
VENFGYFSIYRNSTLHLIDFSGQDFFTRHVRISGGEQVIFALFVVSWTQKSTVFNFY